MSVVYLATPLRPILSNLIEPYARPITCANACILVSTPTNDDHPATSTRSAQRTHTAHPSNPTNSLPILLLPSHFSSTDIHLPLPSPIIPKTLFPLPLPLSIFSHSIPFTSIHRPPNIHNPHTLSTILTLPASLLCIIPPPAPPASSARS